MTENQVENKKSRSSRVSKPVTLKFSPIVWEKFRDLARKEQLPYGLALEIVMSEAIERVYIVKIRENQP